MRELKNYLIRHIVYGMVHSFLTNTKSVKQRAVGVYKQPFLGTSYTNIISAKHLIGQLSRLRDNLNSANFQKFLRKSVIS